MKVFPIGDIHAEFYKDQKKFILKDLYDILPDADICVIAGDITVMGLNQFIAYSHVIPYKHLDIFKIFLKKYSDVVFVLGNHDYYNAKSTDVVHDTMKKVKFYENLHWLNNSYEIINGINFYGGTLWFDKNYSQPLKYNLNDFHVINPKSKFPDFVNKMHKKFVNNLFDNLVLDNVKYDIVVSHYAPSFNSISPDYKKKCVYDLSSFFYSEDAEIILQKLYHENMQPKYWIHGHTHNSIAYELYETKIVCNSYGYPQERGMTGFNKDLILEI